ALDLAFTKLEGRLRKAAERRKVRKGDLTVRSTDALAAVAAAPAGPSARAADAVVLSDVAIPAIPAPDAAAMLKGTPVGRKANDRANGRANGHRRGETVVPLPAMPDDDADDDYDLAGRLRPAADPDGGRRPAGGAGEVPRLTCDDDRPSVVRDGTGRPRLLRL